MQIGGRRYDRDQVIAVAVISAVFIFMAQQGREIVENIAAPDTVTAATAGVASPAPDGSGCTEDDPTTSGCLTPAAAHGLAEIGRVFGGYAGGPVIRSTSCWDRHAWNPSSDHPKGKGCDLFPGKFGIFPEGAELDHGWQVAHWVFANQGPLAIKYVIWQGRIWSDQRDNWGDPRGAPYTGGGVYDPTDATGGHFDHLHLSFER